MTCRGVHSFFIIILSSLLLLTVLCPQFFGNVLCGAQVMQQAWTKKGQPASACLYFFLKNFVFSRTSGENLFAFLALNARLLVLNQEQWLKTKNQCQAKMQMRCKDSVLLIRPQGEILMTLQHLYSIFSSRRLKSLSEHHANKSAVSSALSACIVPCAVCRQFQCRRATCCSSAYLVSSQLKLLE